MFSDEKKRSEFVEFITDKFTSIKISKKFHPVTSDSQYSNLFKSSSPKMCKKKRNLCEKIRRKIVDSQYQNGDLKFFFL